MRLNLILLTFMFCWTNTFAQKKLKPVNIIFDSDIGPDYDDVGAIAILHALADNGEAKILATMGCNKYEGIVPILNIFNTYFKRPNTPIGVAKGKAVNFRDNQHWTDSLIARYPHKLKSNADAEDAVKLYRRILTMQPDHSVTIITVGFLTNISDLLNSAADAYSPLSGKELINKKVKTLVSMAGKFPSGREFNIYEDVGASNNVFQNITIPIIFTGYEIGAKIRSGLPLISNSAIRRSPVKDAFRICLPASADDAQGRMSWDQTAVLIAVRGYQNYYDLQKGKMNLVAADGKNTWDNNGSGHGYAVEKMDHKEVEAIINELMMHRPK